ncbi:ABC transporter ATP-binding protein [Aquamicrobium soli]|jgi:putative spermidine/putrescine transport system ATP-binding protein|uniref:Spermidine/putrescine import ATP-binding protein PotA n=1 Tax=Aquamicrobium soli TaxID=1811518 RepID=A0ABV7K752_9HYPH
MAGPVNPQSAGPRESDDFVRFTDVEKTYDGVSIVVKRLSLSVRRGEFLTMLGPSGSGKTTTLMMLAGFEMPTAGTIHLDGKPIERLPPHQRNIGVVFQNYALFPHMTIEENVGFPLRMRGVPREEIRQRVDRAVAMVQMNGFSSRKPGQLSGGQQQRIALARSLVFEPKLVLMDEPLGALDKQLREHMQLEIKQLHDELGITVVYVTHDQSEALTMSDRIAVFNDGIVQQLGTPDEIYSLPANPFVARFIGDNNAISARVVGIDDANCRISIEGAAQGTFGSVRAGSVRLGELATLSIRPERLVVAPAADVPNRTDATIRQIIYLGDHIRLRVEALGCDDLIIKVPNGSALPTEFSPGNIIPIGWRSEDCRAFAPAT